jgi:site-specific recombinase XerD
MRIGAKMDTSGKENTMMRVNYEIEMKAFVFKLEQADCSENVIASHRRCYETLRAYLSANGIEFTMEAALQWLEGRRVCLPQKSYGEYRYALFHFEKYLLNGSIGRTRCSSVSQFSCRDAAMGLPWLMRELYCKLKAEFHAESTEAKANYYSQGCKDFLLFAAERGCNAATELTIEHAIEYASRFRGMAERIQEKEAIRLAGVAKMLAHLAECGDIPYCYSSVLHKDNAVTLLPLFKFDAIGRAFRPSKKLEPLAEAFLSSLDERGYSASVKKKYRQDFINYFLFIEVNHLEYSAESVRLWLSRSPQNATWERKRHTLALFADYLSDGSIKKGFSYAWQPLAIDSLPDWSRSIILGFVAERKREGAAYTTLKLCRSASCRFFKFLDSKEVCGPKRITPELVKEFHNTEKHSTAPGKNAYGIKVRQLLSYMAEQNLVPQNLFMAISPQCAPCENIVAVMSEEMESAVYQYRARATTPLELRNIAIVMLGLRMGIRASDIVNLKISDFKWQNAVVSFAQKKTGKHISLPLPVDVGNSVYKYIIEGRPQSGAQDGGYVFVRHHAPFGEMKNIQACRYALKKILSAYGLELPPGQGFHITRKTFATRLLASKNSIDDISNALGHALQKTAETYLARDEEGMRLCPLPFESVGAV